MKTSIQQLVSTRETIGALWLVVGLLGLIAPIVSVCARTTNGVDYFYGGFSLFAISMAASGMTAPWMFPGLVTEDHPGNSKTMHIVASTISIFVALVLFGAIMSKFYAARELVTRLDALVVADRVDTADKTLLRDFGTCLKSALAESILFTDTGGCVMAIQYWHGPGAMYRIDQLL